MIPVPPKNSVRVVTKELASFGGIGTSRQHNRFPKRGKIRTLEFCDHLGKTRPQPFARADPFQYDCPFAECGSIESWAFFRRSSYFSGHSFLAALPPRSRSSHCVSRWRCSSSPSNARSCARAIGSSEYCCLDCGRTGAPRWPSCSPKRSSSGIEWDSSCIGGGNRGPANPDAHALNARSVL